MISQESLKELLSYDKETGVLTWKERGVELFYHCKYPDSICDMWNTRHAGNECGCVHKIDQNFYRMTRVNYVLYKSHRLAWLYVYGEYPDKIDHIDGDGLNNKIENLRNVSSHENSKNQSMRINNLSGFNGVGFDKRRGKWRVRIGVNGKSISGGLFVDLKMAIEKRKQMNIDYGFHKNHGRKSD